MSRAGSTEPTESEVLDALGRTGFLLEQRVAQIFKQKHDFDVELNYPFVDQETGKSREIDVYASRAGFAGDSSTGAPFVDSMYFVECKNTEDPLLLIGPEDFSRGYYANVFKSDFDPLSLGWEGESRPYNTANFLRFYNIPGNPQEARFTGNQLVKMNRQSGKWRADNSGIFDGVTYPLAKISHHMAKKDESVPDEDLVPSYTLLSCILVTSGPLYAVAVGAEESSVQKVPWAPLARSFSGDGLRGTYLFEVVQYEHLSRYLDNVTIRYYNGIVERLVENSRICNPRWLVQQFGQPRNRDLFALWTSNYNRRNGLPSEG